MNTNKDTEQESISKIINDNLAVRDELANLKRVADIVNVISKEFDGLIVTSASEVHIKEIAELWANSATVQQIYAPERYSFKTESKNWHEFVRSKLSKKNNLLLVAHKKNDKEVMGFLYLQTVTIPSSDLIVKGIIEDIYTKPQYRREGIALKLFEVCLDWAVKQSIKQIDLITLAKSRDLMLFYLKAIKNFKHDVNLELLTF